MNKKNLTIFKNESIKEAFTKINLNTYGIIFITDFDEKVIGCATDGDIRTILLNGLVLEDKIHLCINKNCISVIIFRRSISTQFT